MAQARGSAGQVVIDFETVYGVDPTSVNGISMPFNSCGVRADRSIAEPRTIRASRQPAMPIHGNYDVRGPLVVPVDEVAIGYWLRALLGEHGVSGVGDPYTHTFTLGSSIESLVLEAGFTDIGRYHKFNGIKVNSMALAVGGEGEIVANLEVVGAKETPSGTAYDSTPTALTFTRFNQFQATLEEGGSAIAYVKSVNLTINNNLDPDQFVIASGGIRGGLPEGMVAVSGNIVALFQDNTLYAKAVAGTESKLKIIFTQGTHSLTFYLAELQYKRNSPIIEGPGGVVVDLPFFAYYENDADAEALKVTLVNGYADYVP